MWIAILRFDFTIPGARSLKDRRQVVKSLKERIQTRFNVCCAEVADLDTWTRASLGVTACANDRHWIQELSDEIVRYAGNDSGALLGHVERDLFRFGDAEPVGSWQDEEEPEDEAE